jgi:hypothetical protein
MNEKLYSILARTRHFFLLRNVQTTSLAHPAPYTSIGIFLSPPPAELDLAL